MLNGCCCDWLVCLVWTCRHLETNLEKLARKVPYKVTLFLSVVANTGDTWVAAPRFCCNSDDQTAECPLRDVSAVTEYTQVCRWVSHLQSLQPHKGLLLKQHTDYTRACPCSALGAVTHDNTFAVWYIHELYCLNMQPKLQESTQGAHGWQHSSKGYL